MEMLDYYDEEGNFLGTKSRAEVHEEALWHKTVHCWLYDNKGNVYFQIRHDEGTLYTTASGHILAGETVKEGFGREITEEIGIPVNYEGATLVEINHFIMDKVKKDGSNFRDRAFANVYCCEYTGDIQELDFDPNELDGLVKVNAKDTLDLFNDKINEINSTYITGTKGNIKEEEKKINKEVFLLNQGETLITKYGKVLEKIVELSEV